MIASMADPMMPERRARLSWISRSARLRSVMSRAMEEMPMMSPRAFLIGDTVSETSMGRPSLRMRTVS